MNSRLIWLLPVVLLALGISFLQSSYQRVRLLRAQVAELQQSLDQLKLPQTAAFAALKPSELPKAYQWLFQQAEELGIQLIRLEPQDAQATLVVQGSFVAVTAYLKRLDQPPFALWVERYSLQPQLPTGELLQLELRIALRLDN